MSNDFNPPGPNPYMSPTGPGGQPFGAPVPGKQLPPSGLAITSLILGSISIVFACCCGWLSLPLSIAGAITGFLALNQANSGQAGGKGLAIAGLICSGFALVLAIVMVILSIFIQMPGIMEAIQQNQ